MKAKLIVEDKEFEININHPELEKLIKPEKKIGYERMGTNKIYYSISCDNIITNCRETDSTISRQLYDIANYYSDPIVAENNARADKLMRQLRRFAVEHRKKEIDWNNDKERKWRIYFNYSEKNFFIGCSHFVKDFFSIYFDSEETAKLAIEAFRNELIWYFTEYKDSL